MARGAVGRRRAGRATGQAKALKHARYALWKNPENLTDRQQAKLAWIAKTDPRLHRAYLLKEGLRRSSASPGRSTRGPGQVGGLGPPLPDPRVRCPATPIVKHKESILAAIEHGLSNGRIESVNTKIRLITRIAFGFATPALIALAMLSLGGHPPTLPGRTDPRISQESPKCAGPRRFSLRSGTTRTASHSRSAAVDAATLPAA